VCFSFILRVDVVVVPLKKRILANQTVDNYGNFAGFILGSFLGGVIFGFQLDAPSMSKRLASAIGTDYDCPVGYFSTLPGLKTNFGNTKYIRRVWLSLCHLGVDGLSLRRQHSIIKQHRVVKCL